MWIPPLQQERSTIGLKEKIIYLFSSSSRRWSLGDSNAFSGVIGGNKHYCICDTKDSK